MTPFLDGIRAALDANPFDHPDERRKWEAATAVSDGPCSAVLTMALLDGPRRSHALLEGYERP